MRRSFTSILLVLILGFLVAGAIPARSVWAEEAVTHGEAAEAEAHSGNSVPMSFKTDLALWSLITFVVFVLVLRMFAWGPLVEGLDKREARLRQDVADAEAARIRAEQLLAEHSARLDKAQEEVREIIAEARRDADHTKNEIIAEAQREAEATKTRVIAEIERSRDQALKELFDQMAAQVAVAAEHVLGRSVTDADQERLIEEALAEVAQR